MIEIRQLEKSFGDKKVLDRLTCTIKAGDIYGLLGPNGAGKSTTINILTGLLEADGGNIDFKGEPVSAATKQHVGIVPQEIALYKDLTCRENLNFFAKLYGLTNEQLRHRIAELIDIFNLEKYQNSPVSKLSGGWQRRVNIAVALVHSPEILLLDEPTAGLDIEARFELWELIKKLHRHEVTILLTTHLLEEAERLCSRMGIMKAGHLAAEGSLDELRKTVPAQRIARVAALDETQLTGAAAALGWQCRNYGDGLLLLLPENLTLKRLVDQLDGVALTSATLQDVRLEHVYLELTSLCEKA